MSKEYTEEVLKDYIQERSLALKQQIHCLEALRVRINTAIKEAEVMQTSETYFDAAKDTISYCSVLDEYPRVIDRINDTTAKIRSLKRVLAEEESKKE